MRGGELRVRLTSPPTGCTKMRDRRLPRRPLGLWETAVVAYAVIAGAVAVALAVAVLWISLDADGQPYKPSADAALRYDWP